jgi:type II secretory pathway pseudopilin PulG
MKYFQSYFSHNKPGFTLIEALLVMAVLITVLGLSTVGVVRFRDSLELQNGYTDIVSYLGTVQNRARNSIAYNFEGNRPYVPTFYSIYFENNDFSLLGCDETSLGIVDCRSLEVDIKSNAFNEVTLELTGECGDNNIIAFKRSSIEIVGIQGDIIRIGDSITGESLSTVNDGQCTLILGHSSLSSTREINFNLVSNTVSFEEN